jgi:hypothetical protein
MRVFGIVASALLIASCGGPGASLAQAIKDTPTPPGELAAQAAALIGKEIAYGKQSKIADRSPHAKADDWRFGLEYGAEGPLVRAADANEIGKGALSIRTENDYGARCNRAGKEIGFTIDMDPRLNAKTDAGKPGDHAEAWLTFADRGVFDPHPRKIALGYNWDAVNLNFALDSAELTRRGAFALCQTAKLPDSPGAHCARFSLKGFARAFDFVCEAK